jgi:hypothetical protein
MSTLLWAAWVAAVGLLASGAAWVVEPVLRALRWPTRPLWALALAAQLAAVAYALLAPDAARPAAWLALPWALGTIAAVVVYLRALRTLRRERGTWRVTIAEEMPVWVSERTGPAVVGFLRSIIVAPAWVLALGDRERRLLLRHEAEHVAAWDPTLLLAGLVTCAFLPWSPAAWWALARLRLAIEVDCDRRVLQADPDVATYGELLVAVQGRVVPGAAGIAAFAEQCRPLEERIEAMTARRPRGAAWRWSARGAVASALVVAACMAPRPQGAVVPTELAAAPPATRHATPEGDVTITGSSMRSVQNPDGSQTVYMPHALITRGPNGTQIDMSERARAAWIEESTKAEGAPESTRDRDTHDTLRAHFARPGSAALTHNTLAYVVLDAENRIVTESREQVSRMPAMFTIKPLDMFVRFPALPKTLEVAGTGVITGGTLGQAQGAVVSYWRLAAPSGATERRSEATAQTTQDAERRLLAQVMRAYFARADIADPAPKTIVYLAIDADGRVIGDVREPRGDRPDGRYNVNVTPEVIRRVFPFLPTDAPRHGGVSDAASIGLDVDATISWDYLQAEERPQDAGTRRAIAQLFAAPGGLPRDTAVGIVAAFDAAWRLMEVRRVPVAEVPTFTGVRPSVRERLLPSLRGRDVGIEGVTTGEGRWGLADGSVVHVWKLEDPRTNRHIDRAWIQERVGEALDRHFARAPRPAGTVRAWVLVDPAGRALETAIRDEPANSVTLDTVRARLPLARGRQIEGFGHLDGEAYGLRPASHVVWALEMKPEAVRRRGLSEAPDDVDQVADAQAAQRARAAEDAKASVDEQGVLHRATFRAIDAARAHATRQGVRATDAPVTFRVLFAPDWKVRDTRHDPLIANLDVDSVVTAFPGVRDSSTLRTGVFAAPRGHGFPPGSTIGWAQLHPPKMVMRVVPKRP